MPFGLSAQQRNLMFRQKYADRLDEEPVTVNIGENDEPFLLRPMDPQSRPTKQEAVQAISLMKTSRDWQNLVPFLTGLRMSDRILKNDRWEWLIRRANDEADALGVILECAKQSGRTGLKLDNNSVVQQLFFQLHRKAQRGDFQDPALSKALGLTQAAVNLMESPEHGASKSSQDPRRNPTVIGVMLELHTARALNAARAAGSPNAKDEGGVILAYALRLHGTWSKVNMKEPQTWREAEKLLRDNIPIYNGLRLALQLPTIAGDLANGKALRNSLHNMKVLLLAAKKKAPSDVTARPPQGLEQANLLLVG